MEELLSKVGDMYKIKCEELEQFKKLKAELDFELEQYKKKFSKLETENNDLNVKWNNLTKLMGKVVDKK